MKIPCEIIVWKVLPAIRKEFAKKLVEEHGLSQKETADKMGLTEAAISRYISGKRGGEEIFNGVVTEEITESVKQLVEGNGPKVIEETCRICKFLKSNGEFKDMNFICK
jgi:predicted transcriptional regulator